MVQPKRFLPSVGQEEGERPKRQNSGELRRRSRKLSSEEEEYTTDETSDEEEEDPARQSSSISGRKSSKPPRRWQASEDRRLAESVKLHGEANWKAIASKVGSRNHVQCLQRWKKVLRPGLVKGQWSSKEDSVLMKLATSGYKNWGVLSNHMPGRTSKQCRERWCHHLNPTINKGAYSPEEDKIIVETQARLGNKWSQIAARLPGRTENSIKIRCKALQRKGTSGGGGGSGNCGTGRGGATRKNSVSSSPRSRASSASSAGSAQSCASAADSVADGSLVDSSVADEPMPNSCDAALLPELCPTTGNTPFSGVRRRAGSVVVKREAPPPAAGSGSPPLPNLSAAPGGRGTLFSPPNSPFLQRRPGKGKGLQLSGNSFGSPSGGGGGARIVQTPPPAPAPAPPPSPMPAAVDAGNHGRWRLWPKASAITTNNGPAAPPMRHSLSAPLWTTPAVVGASVGSMKDEFAHQRLPAGGSFLDYVPAERAASVLGIGGSGGPVGFEGASYAPMSGSSRSMSVCGALAHQSQSLQLQQQQQRQHQLQLQQQQQQQQQQLHQQQQQQEPLSYFFESDLNTVMGQASVASAVQEQGQGCLVSGPAPPQRIFASGTAGMPFFGGGLATQQVVARSVACEHAAAAAVVTADKDEGDAAFGDFNGLGVDDLDAVVGGEDDDEDDTAAPLRSCCSFLDLPAEGMVVGDMPLSW